MNDNARCVGLVGLTTLWNIVMFLTFIRLVGWHDWSVWWMIVPFLLYKDVETRKVS